MNRLYIHIGTHKTGSTSIQQALKKMDDPQVEYLEHYPYGWWYKGLIHGSKRVEKIIQEHCREYPVTVISYEELAGYWPNGYSDTMERACVLRQMCTGLDTTIIVYIRDRNEFMYSIWKQSVKQGYSWGWLEFQETFSGAFDWATLLGSYRANFDDVVVRRYKDDVVADFARCVGVELDTTIRANKSYADWKIRVARLIYPHVGFRTRMALWKVFR